MMYKITDHENDENPLVVNIYICNPYWDCDSYKQHYLPFATAYEYTHFVQAKQEYALIDAMKICCITE